jgi:putative colanic acid biosynthesis UDP-glucose lipid carrier transferase
MRPFFLIDPHSLPQVISRLQDLWSRPGDWNVMGHQLARPLSPDSPPLLRIFADYSVLILLPIIVSAIYYYAWRLRRRKNGPAMHMTWGVFLPMFGAVAIIIPEVARIIYAMLAGSIFALSLLLLIFRATLARLMPPPSIPAPKKVLILGSGELAWEMYQRTLGQKNYAVSAVFIGGRRNTTFDWSRVHQIHSEHEIADYVTAHGIAEIWITVPMNQSGELHSFQYLLRNTLVDIRWIQDILSVPVLNKKATTVLNMPALDINSPDRQGLGPIKKLVLDKTVAILAITALLPVLLVIAAMIKYSSPGPVIFKQKRLGLDGKIFSIYKFRTMHVGADNGAFQQTTKNDPRLYAVGSFLRRNSLDELPQFINVLLGHMSVVGPRPHALPHNEIFKDLLDVYMVRHRVKPGITGWAQINGHRGEADTVEKMQKRIQLDLYYIQNWSIWLDIRIIALTAWRGWKGKNVY